MAFLDLELDLPRTAMMVPGSPATDRDGKVSILERHVIQLSRHDSLGSVSSRGRGSAFLAMVFGLESPNELADPRLEALRRYAVMFRVLDEAMPADEDERLLQADFAPDALFEIRRLVRAGAVA